MQIIIKCDCGNEISITSPTGKYTQFRDHLNKKKFHFGTVEINNNTLKEFRIECDRCKKQIILGVD